jgi:hypothetical protein
MAALSIRGAADVYVADYERKYNRFMSMTSSDIDDPIVAKQREIIRIAYLRVISGYMRCGLTEDCDYSDGGDAFDRILRSSVEYMVSKGYKYSYLEVAGETTTFTVTYRKHKNFKVNSRKRR